MNNSNIWETRRQRLIKILKTHKILLDLRSIIKELEYSSKKALIEDIKSVSKTLKYDGIHLRINPSTCASCGFIFKQKIESLKIPSKCPKCKQERINWPSVEIKE